jgi:nucleoside-diphosphate-sugar epimerase
MPDKRIYLITGATGFVGSGLLRRLINSHQKVHIILRKQANPWRIKDILDKAVIHISDLADAQALRKIIENVKPDIIYHLATYGAYSYQNDTDKIINTNIFGAWNLLKASANIGYELFINTGSSSEYGFKELPMKETDLLEPKSYYAVTKCSETLLCSYAAQKEKKPIVTLRPFSVFGPYEEPGRLIPALFKALYFKERIDMVSPEIARDQIYIDDVIDAYLLIGQLKRFPGEIFNIGTGRQSTIKKVVETAVKVTGRTADFNWGGMEKRSWDTNNWVADISKTEKLLNWTPKISLERGLSLTWEWFKDNYHFYIRS